MKMKMMTIKQFCDTHHACAPGVEWALANCKDMPEVWATARPYWLIWVATRPGVLTLTELVDFARYCAGRALEISTALGAASWVRTNVASAAAIHAAEAAAIHDAEAVRNWAEIAAYALAWVNSAESAKEQAAQAKWLRENTSPSFAMDAMDDI